MKNAHRNDRRQGLQNMCSFPPPSQNSAIKRQL